MKWGGTEGAKIVLVTPLCQLLWPRLCPAWPVKDTTMLLFMLSL